MRYVAFMVAVRSMFYIDMDRWLLGRADMFMLCLLAALIAGVFPVSEKWLCRLACVALPLLTFYLDRPTGALMAKTYAEPVTFDRIALLEQQACTK